jgi:hypothetical protein
MNCATIALLFFSWLTPKEAIVADGYVDKLSVHVGDSLTVLCCGYTI